VRGDAALRGAAQAGRGALASVATGAAAWCWSASIPRCARRRWRRCGRACWATAGSSCGRWRRPGWSAPRRRRARRRRPGRFTTSAPGAEWAGEHFDDGAWPSGEAGFGTPCPGSPGDAVDRRGHLAAPGFEVAAPVDEATVVRLLGRGGRGVDQRHKAWTCRASPPRTAPCRSTTARAAALHPGRNVIAVHLPQPRRRAVHRPGARHRRGGGGPAHAHDLLLDGPLGE